MMNFSRREGGWLGVNILFPEHNSATLRNVLMVLGKNIEQVNVDCRCKNDNSANHGFLNYLPLFIFVLSFGPVSQ